VIAWSTARTALHAWVVAATGISEENVRWVKTGVPRAAAPYISMRILSVAPIGQDWAASTDAAIPAPGAELTYRTCGQRVFVLRLQAFGDTAEQSLELLAGSRWSPPQASALNTAGVGVTSVGIVQSMDGMANGLFEQRAVCEIRGLLSSEIVETATYIETAEIENETTGDEFVVDSTP
jgi:hypothetical protein